MEDRIDGHEGHSGGSGRSRGAGGGALGHAKGFDGPLQVCGVDRCERIDDPLLQSRLERITFGVRAAPTLAPPLAPYLMLRSAPPFEAVIAYVVEGTNAVGWIFDRQRRWVAVDEDLVRQLLTPRVRLPDDTAAELGLRPLPRDRSIWAVLAVVLVALAASAVWYLLLRGGRAHAGGDSRAAGVAARRADRPSAP